MVLNLKQQLSFHFISSLCIKSYSFCNINITLSFCIWNYLKNSYREKKDAWYNYILGKRILIYKPEKINVVILTCYVLKV